MYVCVHARVCSIVRVATVFRNEIRQKCRSGYQASAYDLEFKPRPTLTTFARVVH